MDRQKWSKRRRWLGWSGRADRQPTDPVRVCGTAQLTQERAQGAVTQCWSSTFQPLYTAQAGRGEGRALPCSLHGLCCLPGLVKLGAAPSSIPSSCLRPPHLWSILHQAAVNRHQLLCTSQAAQRGSKVEQKIWLWGSCSHLTCLFLSASLFFFFNNDRIFRTGDTTK